MAHLRIFLSSPGDVTAERAIAKEVINQLPYNALLHRSISFEVVAWDMAGAPGLDAKMVPQASLDRGLPKPSECDITIGILWSRIGTPFEMNGERYESGTLYELEDARRGPGDVLIYRRTEKVYLDSDDPALDERREQHKKVKSYFESFHDESDNARFAYNTYEKQSDFEKKLTQHLTAIIARRLPTMEVSGSLAPAWEGSPFPGLRAFTTADAPIFFGRGREVDDLVRLIAVWPVLIVMGASGSGKSSLIGAGLRPRLRAGAVEGSCDWCVPQFDQAEKQWLGLRFSPAESENDPFQALAARLAPLIGENPSTLAEELRSEVTALAGRTSPLISGGRKVVIFVDQFEEIFTSVTEANRLAFVRLLAHPNPSIRWVVTVRSDFYHKCVDDPDLSRLLEHGQFPLSAPTETLLDMITRPASRACIDFEEGLTARILDDTGREPGSLALMAYALDELYLISLRRDDRILTISDYENLGGVQGAIGKRAEQAFAGLTLTSAQKEKCLQRVFRELIEVDERGVATRRRAPISEVGRDSNENSFIYAFVEARLLITSDGKGDGQIEVAHEALLRSWPRLARWIEATQADHILLRQLRTAAIQWDASGRSHDYLWRGEKADQAQAMLTRLEPSLNLLEIAFSRPEADHLIDELHADKTEHFRREAIGQRLSVLGDPRPGICCRHGIPQLEWCRVEIGSARQARFLDQDKEPFGTFDLHEFFISKYPVSSAQFLAFVNAKDGASDDQWWQGFEKADRKLNSNSSMSANYPASGISWHGAVAFSRWMTSVTPEALLPEPNVGWSIRLPHEWEWQWAALGSDNGHDFPWGEWDPSKCNLKESGIGRITAVGLYPGGVAKCGALDMVGNVRHWCLNAFKSVSDISYSGTLARAQRGGSIYQDRPRASATYRSSNGPTNSMPEMGFRLVYAPPIVSAPLTSI